MIKNKTEVIKHLEEQIMAMEKEVAFQESQRRFLSKRYLKEPNNKQLEQVYLKAEHAPKDLLEQIADVEKVIKEIKEDKFKVC